MPHAFVIGVGGGFEEGIIKETTILIYVGVSRGYRAIITYNVLGLGLQRDIWQINTTCTIQASCNMINVHKNC